VVGTGPPQPAQPPGPAFAPAVAARRAGNALGRLTIFRKGTRKRVICTPVGDGYRCRATWFSPPCGCRYVARVLVPAKGVARVVSVRRLKKGRSRKPSPRRDLAPLSVPRR
jgi:hypothetical protein